MVAPRAQKSNMSAQTGARVGKALRAGEALSGAGAAGTEGLLQLIKNYSRNHKIKTSITVGVIGYPNVGKSRCEARVAVRFGHVPV
jgi:nuclear GTP-binding protein